MFEFIWGIVILNFFLFPVLPFKTKRYYKHTTTFFPPRDTLKDILFFFITCLPPNHYPIPASPGIGLS